MKEFKTLIYILVGCLVISLGLAGKSFYDKLQFNKINIQLNEELMAANLEVGKAKTKFDKAEKYAEMITWELADTVRERDEAITRIGWFQGQLKTKNQQLANTNSDITYVEGPSIEVPADCPAYETGMLYQAISEKYLLPLQSVETKATDFRIKIDVGVYPRPNNERSIPFKVGYQLDQKFKGELVESLSTTGARNFYLKLYEMDQDKIVNEVQLTDFEVVIDDNTSPAFWWWAPTLDVGLNLSMSKQKKIRYGGSMGISFMGFGINKNRLSWRFLRLSLDLQETPGVGFSPLLYNIADQIPLVKNLWIGPQISYFIDQEWTAGFMFGAGL